MQAARLRSLHGALAKLLVPLLIGLAAAGGTLVWAQWEARRGEVESRVLASAQHLAVLLEREVAIETAVIQALSHSPLIDARDWRSLHALARRIVAQRPAALIALTDATGQIVVNTAIELGEPTVNLYELEETQRKVEWRGNPLPLSTRGLTRHARETGQPVYSNLYHGVATREPSLAIAVAVDRGGERPYTLTYAFPARALAEFVATRKSFAGALAQVLDRDGRVVASSESHEEFLARRAPSGLIESAHAAVVKAPYPDTRTHLVARADAGPSGWKVVLSVPASRAYAPAYQALGASLAFLAGAMGLAAFLVYRHSRRLTEPLLQLAARVRGEAAPVSPAATDIREIALLADAIRTAEEGRAREREEQVRRRLAEEREAHARELTGELQRADRRKNEFLGHLGHELRNPLGPLLNAVHLLEPPEGAVKPDIAKIKGIMLRQLKHLACLVEDLLDVTRIAGGKIELRPRVVDVAALVGRLADDHEAVLAEARIRLAFERPEAPLVAELDPTRLTQMVTNLLQNAARFTPAGGEVVVRAEQAGQAVRITVRDSGVGIAPEKLDRLFEPYVQGSQDGARGGGGLGLGLAIVKGLAELQGGRVYATSDGPGKGAAFTIELPLARA